MNRTEDICKICGNPKSSRSGSMSSYVRLCNCDLKLEVDNEIEIQLCQSCGKRIGKGRDGSITQFIFRSDTCSCDAPSLKNSASIEEESFDEPSQNYEEIEIPLQSQSYPVDRYKPLELLGIGAYSKVYLSRDRLLGKKVAIKLLHTVEPKELILFQKEAKATSKLKHKHIIEILDFGSTEDDAPYMVLEYFPGKTLESILKEEGSLPAKETIEIISKVASALEYAHQNKVFHRDLKPSNILVQKVGKDIKVKLIDFGIAAVQESTLNKLEYQGKTLAGTPNYMSPDLLNGQRFNESSEVYSLGCVLYEALAGKTVFHGETALEILASHANKNPEPLSNDSIPSGLVKVVDRCLEKNPDDRFSSMHSLLQALQGNSFETQAIEKSKLENPTTGSSISKMAIVIACITLPLLIVSVTINQLSLESQKNKAKVNKVKSEVETQKAFLKEFNSKFRKDTLNDSIYQSWAAKEPSRFSDQDLRTINKYNNIVRDLDLRNANVTDKGIDYLSNLNLLVLKLEGTQITDDAGASINKFVGLIDLVVSDTAFGDRGVAKLNNLRLERFSANHCKNFSDEGLSTIVGLWPELIRLDISNTSVSKEGLMQITKLKKLKDLSISGLPISKKLAISLKSCPIEFLNIVFANVSEETMDILVNLPELKSIAVIGTLSELDKWKEKTTKKHPHIRIYNTTNMSAKKVPDVNEFNQFIDLIDAKGIHD